MPQPKYFISYAHADEEFAVMLARELMGRGFNISIAGSDAWASERWDWVIDHALRDCDAMIVMLSPDAVSSRFVMDTVHYAWRDEKSIFPVILRACDIPYPLDRIHPLDLTSEFDRWRDYPSNGLSEFGLYGLLDALERDQRLRLRLRHSVQASPRFPDDRDLPRAAPPMSSAPRDTPAQARAEPAREPSIVFLGASVPSNVKAGSEFVARFAAYTDEYRAHVSDVMLGESPSSARLLDLHTCQWLAGTKVTVRLTARTLTIKENKQSFIWDGKWHVCRFDVEAPEGVEDQAVVLKFDVIIEELTVATLRPEIFLGPAVRSVAVSARLEQMAPRSAFASYAGQDRAEVMGRVRSLQIFTRMDVFLDCLSLHPGDEWKAELSRQIRDRDLFWLFWSRHAHASKWVEWEWRTALATKSIAGIQPHPLEPADLAPPPAELEQLQFGNAYETLMGALRSSWWRRNLFRARRMFGV